MLALRCFFISLAILCSLAGASSTPIKACTEPAVRKEWRALSTGEKADWIRAVNCLSHLPHDPALTPSVVPSASLIPPVNVSSSYYDDFVYLHMDLNTEIHFVGRFFPWHRWYLYAFEGALKYRCGYNGVSPYWNWTIDAPDFFESSFWKDSNPDSGLGGWGDPNNDYRVPDGGFSQLQLSYPVLHNVRRNFTLLTFEIPFVGFTDHTLEANKTFLATTVEKILEIPDYKVFQKEIEAGPHGAVHLTVGGDLAGSCPRNAPNCIPGPKWAPNDPLFWLHHGMIDKLWYDWQHRNPRNAKSFFGGSVQALSSVELYNQYPNGAPPFLNLNSTLPTDGLFPEVTIGDMMNTTSGFLCYVYE
ncbi:Di-copper centre-containing protein [Lactarius quietus]|nr:Di-copper centre-containing protein [Lactarius quietus]